MRLGSPCEAQQHKLVLEVPADREVEKRTGCLSVSHQSEKERGFSPCGVLTSRTDIETVNGLL